MEELDWQTYQNVAIHLLRYITPGIAFLLLLRCGFALRRAGRLQSLADLLLLSVLQMLICLQFLLRGKFVVYLFGGLIVLQWALYCITIILHRQQFLAETLAFFLCSLGMAVVCAVQPQQAVKQLFAIAIGVVAYLLFVWFFRDPQRAPKWQLPAAVLAAALLMLTLVFGKTYYGAKNWLVWGPFSVQPSELAKPCFLLAGAASADMLRGRGLVLYMAYAAAVCALLVLMNDLGTSLVYFCVFLLTVYLRAGGLRAGILVLAGFGLTGLQMAPHALQRLQTWGQIWQSPLGAGYQQTQALMAIASGGLFGLGAESGRLKGVFAADSDMVFAALSEEWGLLMAFFAVGAILILAVYAIGKLQRSGDCFTVIAASGAAAVLLLQTILNTLGTLDILPFTGVTFPFVSNGGSSMVSVWCLLAFANTKEHNDEECYRP